MMTNEELKSLLDYRFGSVAMSVETQFFLGLHVGASAPSLSDGSGFVEPSSGSGYVRATVPNDDSFWSGASVAVSGPNAGSIVKFNVAEVAFPAAESAWGMPTHAGLFSATSGGVPVAIAVTSGANEVEAGDLTRFSPGGLTFILRRAAT